MAHVDLARRIFVLLFFLKFLGDCAHFLTLGILNSLLELCIAWIDLQTLHWRENQSIASQNNQPIQIIAYL